MSLISSGLQYNVFAFETILLQEQEKRRYDKHQQKFEKSCLWAESENHSICFQSRQWNQTATCRHADVIVTSSLMLTKQPSAAVQTVVVVFVSSLANTNTNIRSRTHFHRLYHYCSQKPITSTHLHLSNLYFWLVADLDFGDFLAFDLVCHSRLTLSSMFSQFFLNHDIIKPRLILLAYTVCTTITSRVACTDYMY